MTIAALQRVLFRMQCDPDFAARTLAGDAAGLQALGLDAGAQALLRSADESRIVADPGGKRRLQVLSNLSAEFEISARLLAAGSAGCGSPAAFFASSEFHEAVRDDGLLPFAFGAYVLRVALSAGDRAAEAAVRLDAALAEARRGPRTAPELRDKPLLRDTRERSDAAFDAAGPRLSDLARLTVVRAGATDGLAAAKDAILGGDRGDLRRFFAPVEVAASYECALVVGLPRTSPHRPAAVRIERLEPLVHALLAAAEDRPLDVSAFAAEHGLDRDDVLAFASELVAEGVLVVSRR